MLQVSVSEFTCSVEIKSKLVPLEIDAIFK